MLRNLRLAVASLLLRKEIEDMAYVYALLITKEEYDYSKLAPKMKEKVKAILIEMDCEEYITD